MATAITYVVVVMRHGEKMGRKKVGSLSLERVQLGVNESCLQINLKPDTNTQILGLEKVIQPIFVGIYMGTSVMPETVFDKKGKVSLGSRMLFPFSAAQKLFKFFFAVRCGYMICSCLSFMHCIKFLPYHNC